MALDETPTAPESAVHPARGSATPSRVAVWTGIGSGLATFVFLLFGVTRAYDIDDSLTVGVFVATPSISDAFTQAYVLNNHVFFSFLEHLVYTSTGSQSEPVMRMLPTVFAAVSVGVLAYLLSRRWGVVAAVSGAALMATNPMFADVGSQVRGYSLLMLCTIVSTALVIRAVRRGGASDGMRLLYALVIAVGVATHLYMLVVVAIHGLLTLADRRVTRSWIVPWLGGIVIGSAAYVRVWRPMRETADELGRNFRPVFPRDLGYALLGGSLLAVILVAILVLPPLWNARAGPAGAARCARGAARGRGDLGHRPVRPLPPVLPVAPAPDRDRRGGGGRAPTAARRARRRDRGRPALQQLAATDPGLPRRARPSPACSTVSMTRAVARAPSIRSRRSACSGTATSSRWRTRGSR